MNGLFKSYPNCEIRFENQGQLRLARASLVDQWLKKKKICLQRRIPGFNSWIGKIPWRRAWQPTPVFLPGKFHGQRSLEGYSPQGCTESDRTEATEQQQQQASVSSVKWLRSVQLFSTPWTAAHQASLSITNSWSLLKLMSIESVMPSNHLILSRPLLLPPSVFPSIRVFSNELVLRIRWPKYWSFSFSISPSNQYLGLISFRMDWLDPPAIQGTLKSLLQHHSSKASILQLSAFFIVQFSHPYMTTGKTIALTRWTFVGKVMSLLFNMLSRLVIAFLPRSKCLLLSWLQSPSSVILEPRKIKSLTVFIVSPYLP